MYRRYSGREILRCVPAVAMVIYTPADHLMDSNEHLSAMSLRKQTFFF